ncbi:putative 2-oxoisovalerate dehydrogenase alpha subunit [Nadsonia fulvescens var. elongata DSM 6958]|uniref:2-oxoisovalerate dehydrogenase subunit alpha n=1 Tax=Nadsonia fulvescens var. elongata DSM 6958 TaxID=857566 RepID=A0A1E3PJ57_9ASCO|nr:putative 2-oxoisovalerate dehydrogenase alpha subunit [Nadsonia fulvescens var. elongata DSM 6958]
MNVLIRLTKSTLAYPGAEKSLITPQLVFNDPTTLPVISTFRILSPTGALVDNNHSLTITSEKIVDLYKHMVTLHTLDTIMYDAQRQGRLSFYMTSSGEEAVSVASGAILEKHDQIFAQYREQGAFLARGLSVQDIMNQLYANSNDHGKGRNMPIHHVNKAINLHPISSPLATQIPHAVGAAYALKLTKPNQACSICYVGEGACSEGDFHAGLNIAATRECPVIFFVRNNGYAISTASKEQYKGDGIASRGPGYGIVTIRIDGNDLLAVYEATKAARDLAVKENRPVLIEAMTYRRSHHSTSDDSFAYRSKHEVDAWKRHDNPISRIRKYMQRPDINIWSDELEEKFRKATKKDILKCLQIAERTKKPPLSEIFTDVYFDNGGKELQPHLKEQKEELDEILAQYRSWYHLEDYKA